MTYTPDLSYAAQLRRSHESEWADGWQYGHVWQFAEATETEFPEGPPPGTGWELNEDKPPTATPPRWSEDGSVVQQVVYWRRPVARRQNPARLIRPAVVNDNRRPWWVGSAGSLADAPPAT